MELLTVLLTHAEHPRDHRERKWHRDVGNQIDRLTTPSGHLVEDLAHDPLDVSGHLLHHRAG